MNKYRALLAVLFLLGAAVPGAAQKKKEAAENRRSVLRDSMRKLWAERAIWTRGYILASIGGTLDARESAERLFRNQEELGNTLGLYLPDKAGGRFTELLKQDILITADAVDAAKAADEGKLQRTDRRWRENANAIADFLSRASPHLPKSVFAEMLEGYVASTTKETLSRIHKRWPEDISAFDETFTRSLEIADVISAGILKQFPEKFNGLPAGRN